MKSLCLGANIKSVSTKCPTIKVLDVRLIILLSWKSLWWWLQVSLPIVRQFVKGVEEKALGVQVIKGVKPEQMLVRVVNDELVELMGGKREDLVDPDSGPQVRLLLRALPNSSLQCLMLNIPCTDLIIKSCFRCTILHLAIPQGRSTLFSPDIIKPK